MKTDCIIALLKEKIKLLESTPDWMICKEWCEEMKELDDALEKLEND